MMYIVNKVREMADIGVHILKSAVAVGSLGTDVQVFLL